MTAEAECTINYPVEFIYFDPVKIEGAYDQLPHELDLVKAVMEKKKKGSLSASAGEQMEIHGETANEQWRQETFVENQQALALKTRKLINSLAVAAQIFSIRTINIQNNELSEFEKAVSLINKTYSIQLPDDQIRKVRNQIITRSLIKDRLADFETGAWVIISGPFDIETSETLTRFSFIYVPTIPSKVQFYFEVDKGAESKDNDVPSLTSHNDWDLHVFGKIIHKDGTDDNMRYKINCYAIYR